MDRACFIDRAIDEVGSGGRALERSAGGAEYSAEVATIVQHARIYVVGHAISSHNSKVLSCHESLLSRYGRSSS